MVDCLGVFYLLWFGFGCWGGVSWFGCYGFTRSAVSWVVVPVGFILVVLLIWWCERLFGLLTC